MIKLNNLSKSFNNKNTTVCVLNNISLEILEGEILACLGLNGSGKSTLIKSILGILKPTDGSVTIDTQNTYQHRNKLNYNYGVILSQKSALIWDLPLIESFKLYKRIYRLREDEYNESLQYIQMHFNIEALMNKPVRKMSFGQRMISEFCLILLHKPKYLFLDEPTVGLDELNKAIFRNLLKTYIKDHKATAIIATHLVGDVESVATRMILLNSGSVVFDDTLEQFRQKYIDRKIIEFTALNAIDPALILKYYPMVSVEKHNDNFISLSVPYAHYIELMNYIMREFTLIDITVEDVPLNELLRIAYEENTLDA